MVAGIVFSLVLFSGQKAQDEHQKKVPVVQARANNSIQIADLTFEIEILIES
jgi:hypothetical protein